MLRTLLIALLSFPVLSAPSPLLIDNCRFVGRFHKAADGGSVSFDMNGAQIVATLSGTTSLDVSMSQIKKVKDNTFQVYLDGIVQPNSRFNTSDWAAGEIVKIPLFPVGSLDADTAHEITIFKDTEPQFAGTTVQPNYITFYGFSGDSHSTRLLPPVLKQTASRRKVEFLGDSITAGFDNQCDIAGSPKGFPWSESFAKSWPTLICNALDAECHYNAWSGFGMVANCCGGSTLASDVWTRTLATVGSTNASDPHGTTAENEWDFSQWTADAVVINLGTNDHLGTKPSAKSEAYKARYEALVVATAKAYSNTTRFFLACGPMSSDYCTEVSWVIDRVGSMGIKAYLLDQRGFDGGAYGRLCAYGHPGSQIDAAMARNGSAFIKKIMGWS